MRDAVVARARLGVTSAVLLVAVLCGACSHLTGPRLVREHDRPYVDIVLDHLGPRSPVLPGESDEGLWLRLRNNTGYQLEVQTLLADDGGRYVLRYDVVFWAAGLYIGPTRTWARLGGYDQYVAGLSPRVPTSVAPGRELLFSVPLTALSLTTAVQVHARLQVPMTWPRGESPSSVAVRFREQPELLVRLRLWDFLLPPAVADRLRAVTP